MRREDPSDAAARASFLGRNREAASIEARGLDTVTPPMSSPPPYPTSSAPNSLSVVDIENAVGSRLSLAELGLAAPLLIAGRYRVMRLLGRGARGVVCQAQDLHLHREVALKLYPALEPGTIDREVALEAQALARLRHPNVVGVYDFGDTMLALEHSPNPLPCFFLAMELVQGQSMRRWSSVGAPDRDQILGAFHQAGAGLAHAHESGVIHRDFKPENVVIADDGRALVVDFGLARHRSGTRLSPESQALALWHPLAIGGTPEYMAPEARLGWANAASDQYSFALALHEALVGWLPTASATGFVTIAHDRLPPAIGQVVARALHPDASLRFASMRELLAALPRRWAPLSSSLELAGDSTSELPRRRVGVPLLALSLSVIGIASAIGLGVWVMGRSSSKPDEDASDRSSLGRSSADDPSSRRAACDFDVVGHWTLETRVVWDFDIARIDQRHDYELDVRRDAECRFWGRMQRMQKHRIADAELFPTWSSNGVVELRGAWDLPETREFTLTITDDQARGDFVMLEAHGRPAIRAFVRGARAGQREPSVTTSRDLPCRSQCRLLCAGDAATETCMTQTCSSHEADIGDCGPPSADFETPQTTKTMQSKWSSGRWLGGGSPLACERGPGQIAGTWTVWRRNETEVERWTLSLEPSGCGVTGFARSTGEVVSVVADFDEFGRWMLYSPSDPERLRWALMGWDFVFGEAGGRAPGKLVGVQSSGT